LYWLPLTVFVAHIAEEYPRFPAWATRHFGATSKAWYVYSHVMLVVVALAVCEWAEGAPSQTWGPILATAFMVTLAVNGLFHVATTFLFREYSPGVITGTLLFFPATGYLLYETLRLERLTGAQIGTAVAIGVAVQIAVIASLYLHMDIDWRFRRQNHATSEARKRRTSGRSA
jgi:hypothetical protein